MAINTKTAMRIAKEQYKNPVNLHLLAKKFDASIIGMSIVMDLFYRMDVISWEEDKPVFKHLDFTEADIEEAENKKWNQNK
jgi:hypothetical protein